MHLKIFLVIFAVVLTQQQWIAAFSIINGSYIEEGCSGVGCGGEILEEDRAKEDDSPVVKNGELPVVLYKHKGAAGDTEKEKKDAQEKWRREEVKRRRKEREETENKRRQEEEEKRRKDQGKHEDHDEEEEEEDNGEEDKGKGSSKKSDGHDKKKEEEDDEEDKGKGSSKKSDGHDKKKEEEEEEEEEEDDDFDNIKLDEKEPVDYAKHPELAEKEIKDFILATLGNIPEAMKKPLKFGATVIPKLAPLIMKRFEFKYEDIKFIIKKARVTGLDNFKVDKLVVDFTAKRFHFILRMVEVVVLGLYDLKGKLNGIVDVYGDGVFQVKVENVSFEIAMDFHINEFKSLEIKTLTTDLKVRDFNVIFQNLMGGNFIGVFTNGMINEYGKLIFNGFVKPKMMEDFCHLLKEKLDAPLLLLNPSAVVKSGTNKG